MVEQTMLTQLLLPWFTPDGELNYSAMTLTVDEGKVAKKPAFKVMSKWYKEEIGVTVDKLTLDRIWKGRHVTRAMSQKQIDTHLHKMARDTYEEAEKITNTGAQEEAAQVTE